MEQRSLAQTTKDTLLFLNWTGSNSRLIQCLEVILMHPKTRKRIEFRGRYVVSIHVILDGDFDSPPPNVMHSDKGCAYILAGTLKL